MFMYIWRTLLHRSLRVKISKNSQFHKVYEHTNTIITKQNIIETQIFTGNMHSVKDISSLLSRQSNLKILKLQCSLAYYYQDISELKFITSSTNIDFTDLSELVSEVLMRIDGLIELNIVMYGSNHYIKSVNYDNYKHVSFER